MRDLVSLTVKLAVCPAIGFIVSGLILTASGTVH